MLKIHDEVMVQDNYEGQSQGYNRHSQYNDSMPDVRPSTSRPSLLKQYLPDKNFEILENFERMPSFTLFSLSKLPLYILYLIINRIHYECIHSARKANEEWQDYKNPIQATVEINLQLNQIILYFEPGTKIYRRYCFVILYNKIEKTEKTALVEFQINIQHLLTY